MLFNDLIDACKLIKQARLAVLEVEGSSGPAWDKLFHAENYLSKQAKAILEGDTYL